MTRRELRDALKSIDARWRRVSELEHSDVDGDVRRAYRHELRIRATAIGFCGLPKLLTIGTITRIGPQWHGFALRRFVLAHDNIARVQVAVFDGVADLLAGRLGVGDDALAERELAQLL